MNEYLTKSNLELVVVVKAGDMDQARQMHKGIANDIADFLNDKFDRGEGTWEIKPDAYGALVTKLPKKGVN